MDSFEAKNCTRMKKDGHVFKQTPSRGIKMKTGECVTALLGSDCSSRVLARARNKTTRRRAKPMEENIVDVLLHSSVSYAPFEEHEPPLSAFTISPDDYSILRFFSFICLSVRRIFPRERQSRSLHLSLRTRANLASIERRANLIPRNVYLPQS